MMTFSVFTYSDYLSNYLSELVLSVSRIVGGGGARIPYTILARGTYLDNIYNGISNCQGGGIESHG